MTTTRNGEWALRRRRSIHAQAAGLYWSSFVSAELLFFSSSFHFYTFFRLASCCCSVELILRDFSLILRLSISVIYCLKNDVTAYSALAVQRTSYLWGCCKLDLLQVQAIIALLKTRLAKTSAKQRNLIIIPPRLFIYTWSIPALQQQHSDTKVLVHILFINRRIISFTSFQVKVEEKPLKKTLFFKKTSFQIVNVLPRMEHQGVRRLLPLALTLSQRSIRKCFIMKQSYLLLLMWISCGGSSTSWHLFIIDLFFLVTYYGDIFPCCWEGKDDFIFCLLVPLLEALY